MDKEFEQLSQSRQSAVRTIFEALTILKESGGQLPGREVIDKVRQRLTFSDWEKGILEKSGYVRWESLLHFFTIDCIKAGYLSDYSSQCVQRFRSILYNPKRD